MFITRSSMLLSFLSTFVAAQILGLVFFRTKLLFPTFVFDILFIGLVICEIFSARKISITDLLLIIVTASVVFVWLTLSYYQ